ncbi:Retrovirus-related Pol polyprotein, partial [Aphis craccivora]
DLITALRFIPEFTDGNETDLASFIARCDFVFSKIPDEIKSDILDVVLTQLKRKAFDAVHLRTIFSTSNSVQYLQAQLSSMRQSPKEMIKDFAQRIEKTYHEFTHALTVGKNNTEANFEEAILIGIEQEKTFGTGGEASKIYERNNKNHSKEKFNKTGEKIDKSKIKCYRCDKMGHYANECRTPEQAEQYITKKTDVKKEYMGQVKYWEPSGSSGESSSSENRTVGDIKNNVRVITPIHAEHILCRSNDFIENEHKFLIDSGADMNIIKLSALKNHVMVNEIEKRNIKGISATTIRTIGTVTIEIFIKDKTFQVKFDIVCDDFLIPETGILGIAFLKANKVIIDMDKDVLIIPESIARNKVEPIIIPARRNCVLRIEADELISSDLVAIKKQEINGDVIIANSLSPIKNNKIISNIINISEQPFIIDELTTSHLKWEPYIDNIFMINQPNNKQAGGKGQPGRLRLLNETIKTEHLNSEEKQNIINICNEYSEIFYLE